MLKKIRKNICIHIFTFYVLTYSFVKKGIFLWLCKKDKKMCRKKAYFSTEFYYYLHRQHTKFFFLKPLHGHLGHGDLHTLFLFKFFIYSHICKKLFQINGAYAPWRKNAVSLLLVSSWWWSHPLDIQYVIYPLYNNRITRIGNTWKTIRD
jgi:hypothetical protein